MTWIVSLAICLLCWWIIRLCRVEPPKIKVLECKGPTDLKDPDRAYLRGRMTLNSGESLIGLARTVAPPKLFGLPRTMLNIELDQGKEYRIEARYGYPDHVYAIGNGELLRKLFQDQGTIYRGAGSAVWRTYEDAEKHLKTLPQPGMDYAEGALPDRIWGIEADWNRDTVEVPMQRYRYLNRKALLFPIGERGKDDRA